MNAGEPGPASEESTESTAVDLRKAPVAAAAADQNSLSNDESSGKVVMPKAAIAPQLITPEPFAGGQDDDGPRPHPWSPTPESNDNSNTGSSSKPSQ